MKKCNKNRKNRQKHLKNYKKGNLGRGGVGADLFGFHAVMEACINPDRKIYELYVTKNSLGKVEAFFQSCGKFPVTPAVVSKDVIDDCVPAGAVHQGVALFCSDLPEVFVSDFVVSANSGAGEKGEDSRKNVVIVLDQVSDPHNVGAVIRSAAAFGADGVVVQKRHAPELKGVLAKTACGGLEHVPVAVETNLARAVEALQEGGFFVVGLDERGKKCIGDLPFYDKIALVLGAEGAGIRRLVAEKCDILASLPTKGAIRSLNVSNAAAVALYAVAECQN